MSATVIILYDPLPIFGSCYDSVSATRNERVKFIEIQPFFIPIFRFISDSTLGSWILESPPKKNGNAEFFCPHLAINLAGNALKEEPTAQPITFSFVVDVTDGRR